MRCSALFRIAKIVRALAYSYCWMIRIEKAGMSKVVCVFAAIPAGAQRAGAGGGKQGGSERRDAGARAAADGVLSQAQAATTAALHLHREHQQRHLRQAGHHGPVPVSPSFRQLPAAAALLSLFRCLPVFYTDLAFINKL